MNEDEKIKMILYSRDEFLKRGFQKTTITEIAESMGIGKNKFYTHFSSKEKLIEEIIFLTSSEINRNFQSIISLKMNAVEKFIKMLQFGAEVILKYHEKFLKELSIHFPPLYRMLEEIRVKYMYNNFSILIQQGKNEKLFKEYPDEVLISIFISIIRTACNYDFISKINYTLDESMKLSFEIFLNGILTTKGKKVLEKLNLFQYDKN